MSSVTNASGRYVPPAKRAGATATTTRRFEDSTVRVSNLPEVATEDDLRELFGHCGHVMRVYLARDWETGRSKCFAFVSFEDRRDAEEAARKINGHGYLNLILNVEMTT